MIFDRRRFGYEESPGTADKVCSLPLCQNTHLPGTTDACIPTCHVINAKTRLNMSVLRSYLLGLIVAHLAWLFFFTTGQLLWKRHPDNSKPFLLDTLVITSGAGVALSGFGLLLLGFAHLLNQFGLAGLLVLGAAYFWLLKRDNWLSFIVWRRIVQDFVKGWTFPAVSIYVVFLALGIPAIAKSTRQGKKKEIFHVPTGSPNKSKFSISRLAVACLFCAFAKHASTATAATARWRLSWSQHR